MKYLCIFMRMRVQDLVERSARDLTPGVSDVSGIKKLNYSCLI